MVCLSSSILLMRSLVPSLSPLHCSHTQIDQSYSHRVAVISGWEINPCFVELGSGSKKSQEISFGEDYQHRFHDHHGPSRLLVCLISIRSQTSMYTYLVSTVGASTHADRRLQRIHSITLWITVSDLTSLTSPEVFLPTDECG
ncbi:hypothetical protein B0H65DRAFT_101664 [Neurospora tetraspora]|uniref:Questionable protein n=1 Tax=Neurospora tetraspora TaxID=94610 RepID=A0AAE0MUE5_9PEZI|nr:hypothetical protein B0H65DRAFT_101664 [Neurospora tetraspora]